MSEEQKMQEGIGEYTADQIQILEGLEAVRKRPGMYIGTTSLRGLHHLVYEIVDNAVDEALAGFCDTIEVELNKDGSVTVADNGRGIPVGIHPKAGIPAVEVHLSDVRAREEFRQVSYVRAACVKTIMGRGFDGYAEAMDALIGEENR